MVMPTDPSPESVAALAEAVGRIAVEDRDRVIAGDYRADTYEEHAVRILAHPFTPEQRAALAAELLTPEVLAEALRAVPVPATYEEWQEAVDRTYESDAAVILAALRERGA